MTIPFTDLKYLLSGSLDIKLNYMRNEKFHEWRNIIQNDIGYTDVSSLYNYQYFRYKLEEENQCFAVGNNCQFMICGDVEDYDNFIVAVKNFDDYVFLKLKYDLKDWKPT